MEGSMTNSPRMVSCSLESERKLVGLVLKVRARGKACEEGTLPPAAESSESVLEEYDGGGCHRKHIQSMLFRM